MEDGDRLIGYIMSRMANTIEPRGYMASLALAPEYRGRGLATRLVNATHRAMKTLGTIGQRVI